MTTLSRRVLAPLLIVTCAWVLPGGSPPRDDPMAEAAAAFLSTLTASHRKAAAHPFEAEARTTWHFVPGPRAGVCLEDLSSPERRAAHGLLRASLSSGGYLKATAVMDLERTLRELTGAERYSSEKYWIAVFGTPGKGPWGWRIEGHHLSLNFSSVTGRVVGVTPLFLGAQPHDVPRGPRAGLKVLGREEALARKLAASCDAAQKKALVISERAPADIIMSPARDEWLEKPVGVAGADMNAGQVALLHALVSEFAGSLRPDLSEAWLARMLTKENPLRFAWAGSLDPARPHYFRVQSPRFIIEYDNIQQNATHVHAVWRDRDRDFGRDLLREHRKKKH